jgi:hypothetical protein
VQLAQAAGNSCGSGYCKHNGATGATSLSLIRDKTRHSAQWQCCYGECHIKSLYAEYHYAEYRYAESRFATLNAVS